MGSGESLPVLTGKESYHFHLIIIIIITMAIFIVLSS